ncbi:MAG: radical SAM family heme chaperone HemW [Alphaproteobacteria bacterium]|nr:radical SAM family heme chaperone HemW [Alphaproteobacteria bacterium]
MADVIATPDTLAIYVHWPFCRSLCPYCDFNSHVSDQVDQGLWRAALLSELEHYAQIAGPRRVTSVFFGGGTPSLMAPETAAAVIAAVGHHFTLDESVEITLEANPTSIEATRLAAFADAGVNRVSLGVQSLDDGALKFLGRTHSAEDAIAAIELAADAFERYSFDLIYARPGQSVAQWQRELEHAIGLARGHLSVYQLTIERGTPFYLAQARGDLDVPDDATSATLFETTQAALSAAGLPAYEISNHAAPGHACRHNLAYWQYRDYIGIGPGAHGRITSAGKIHAARQHRAPEIWLRRTGDHGHATQTFEALDPASVISELAVMGLRVDSGIDAANFRARAGVALDTVVDPATSKRLRDGGLIVHDSDGLRATQAGRQRLDAVVAALFV